MLSVIMLSVIMLTVIMPCDFAECHYAECHFAECHYAECHFAECHYAECHYAESRGIICWAKKPHYPNLRTRQLWSVQPGTLTEGKVSVHLTSLLSQLVLLKSKKVVVSHVLDG